MYERIKAKLESDDPETTKAGTLDLFDDYRRLDTEVSKRKHISPQEAKKLIAEGKAEVYRTKTRELIDLRESFVMTNSWHYMKNECWLLGIW